VKKKDPTRKYRHTTKNIANSRARASQKKDLWFQPSETLIKTQLEKSAKGYIKNVVRNYHFGKNQVITFNLLGFILG